LKIYRRKYSLGISVCIYRFSGSVIPKLTKKGNKNKNNPHPKTLITFKREYKCKGRKGDDFSSPPKPATIIAAATFSLAKKLIQNNLHATFFECLSERRVRISKENQKHEKRKNLEGQLGQQKKRKTKRKRRKKSLKPFLKLV